jgi:hypothetical protein
MSYADIPFFAEEYARNEQDIRNIRQSLAGLTPERRIKFATEMLEHFSRMAEFYNEMCAMLRTAQTGAVGSA